MTLESKELDAVAPTGTTVGKPSSIDQPVRDSYLVFASPQILEAEINEVVASLRSGWLGAGPKVAAFEVQFRDYVGSPIAPSRFRCRRN